MLKAWNSRAINMPSFRYVCIDFGQVQYADYKQIGKIDIEDDNGSVIGWGQFSLSAAWIGYDSYDWLFASNESPINIFDGSFSTKMCASCASKSNRIRPSPRNIFLLSYADGVEASKWKKIKTYTANDAFDRDPKSISVYVSNDCSHWKKCGTCDFEYIKLAYSLLGTIDVSIVDSDFSLPEGNYILLN